MPFSPLKYIRRLRDDRRSLGWRGLLRKHGWKPFAIFFIFYLVRDIILYVVIPLGEYFGIRN